jgi:carbon storage regulator
MLILTRRPGERVVPESASSRRARRPGERVVPESASSRRARRPGERVVIGEEILVTVMAVSGHTVRLGIEAPQGIPIYREEIWLAVMEENRAAAEAAPDALPPLPPQPGATEPAAADEGPGTPPQQP